MAATGGGDVLTQMWSAEHADRDAAIAGALVAHNESEDHRRPRGLVVVGADFVSAAAGGGVFVGAKAHNTTGIIINSGTVTNITLDVEDFDTSAMHDPATNAQRFTIPEDGYYHVVAQAALINFFSTPAADFYFELDIYINGGLVDGPAYERAMRPSEVSAGIWGSVFISDYLQLSAGDYLDLKAAHNASVQMVTDTQTFNRARMAVVKVG